MSAPKISIIIPCYKVEKYLDRCVESVVNQTFRDIEIILVDDCSPDEVPQMCDDWTQKDNRIKVIHKPVNQGLGFARNTGMAAAQGDYVAFIDADDYVDEDMYQKLYNEAVSSCADIVFCGMKQELANGHCVCVSDFSERKVFHKNELQELSIRYFDSPYGRNLIMSVWHSVYKRELISDIRFYSEREVCSEDLPFQVMAFNKANSVSYIPDALYYYCFNTNSLSHSFDFNKCFRFYNLVNKILSYYPREQQYHLWNYFFRSCIGMIRELVRAKQKNRDKINNLKLLSDNNEIVAILISQYRRMTFNRMSRLYYYCLTRHCNFGLYVIAYIDVHIICDKLGMKKIWN